MMDIDELCRKAADEALSCFPAIDMSPRERKTIQINAIAAVREVIGPSLAERDAEIERLMDATYSGYSIINNHSSSNRLSTEEQATWRRWAEEIVEDSGKTLDELMDAYLRLHPEGDAATADGL